MRHERFLIAGAAVVLMAVACDPTSITGPALAQPGKPAATVVSDRVDQDFPLVMEDLNPCTLDDVTLSGTAHVTIETLADEGGGEHLSTTFRFKGTGVGVLTGAYRASDETSFMAQSPDPTGTVRFEWSFVVIGERQIDNFVMHEIAKLTVNANGVPTVLFDRPFWKCTG